MRTRRAAATLAGLVLVAGCLTPTEVKLVVVSRELTCGGGDLAFRSLSIVASPTTAGLLSDLASTSSACKEGASDVDLGSLVLVPKTGQHAEVVIAAGVAISGPKGQAVGTADQCLAAYRDFQRGLDPAASCGGGKCLPCIIATRGVGFVSHEKLSLEVDLTAECQGVFCQAGQTCGREGACVPNAAPCRGGVCELGGGGAGGASSSSTSVSASASSGAGGGGGGGSLFVPVLPPSGSPPLGSVKDLWGTGLDDVVWAATQNGLFQCTPTGCAFVSTPLTPPILRVSGSTSLVAAMNATSYIVRSNGVFPATPSPVACTPSDIFTLGQSVYLGYHSNSIVFVEPVTGAVACSTGSPFAGATTVDSIWVFTGAPPDRWLAGGSVLLSSSGQSISFNNANLIGAWGRVGPGGGWVASCDLQSSHFYVWPSGDANGYPIPQMCDSVWGASRTDNLGVDLWLGVQRGAVGVHFLDATQGSTAKAIDVSLASQLAATDEVQAVFANDQTIWVGSNAGLFRAARPAIP